MMTMMMLRLDSDSRSARTKPSLGNASVGVASIVAEPGTISKPCRRSCLCLASSIGRRHPGACHAGAPSFSLSTRRSSGLDISRPPMVRGACHAGTPCLFAGRHSIGTGRHTEVAFGFIADSFLRRLVSGVPNPGAGFAPQTPGRSLASVPSAPGGRFLLLDGYRRGHYRRRAILDASAAGPSFSAVIGPHPAIASWRSLLSRCLGRLRRWMGASTSWSRTESAGGAVYGGLLL